VNSFSAAFNIFGRDKLKKARTQIVSEKNNKFAHAYFKNCVRIMPRAYDIFSLILSLVWIQMSQKMFDTLKRIRGPVP